MKTMITATEAIVSENQLLYQLSRNIESNCWAIMSGNALTPEQHYRVTRSKKADDHYEFELSNAFGSIWVTFDTPERWYIMAELSRDGLPKKDKSMTAKSGFLKPTEDTNTTRPSHIEMEAVKGAALECLHALYQNLDANKALCLCSTTDRLFKVTVERKG